MIGDVVRAVIGWLMTALTDSTGWCVTFGVTHPFLFAGLVLVGLVTRHIIKSASTVLVLKRRH